MPHTTPSSVEASTAASWAGDGQPGRSIAIHQPNFLPRLNTLGKIFAADVWVVLDDVQFARRDYQHRARLASLNDPTQTRWLTLPTHLASGRSTTIRDARVVQPDYVATRSYRMLRDHYGHSPRWSMVEHCLAPVWDELRRTDSLARVAELSTRAILNALGWRGRVLRSSAMPTRPGRSQRLLDLVQVAGGHQYLCGTGGIGYLDVGLFEAHGITVTRCSPAPSRFWEHGRCLSSVHYLVKYGTTRLNHEFAVIRRQSE
ncbi:MAG: hypothetical protein HOV68_33465 [Streptomycetaceae bacterium]|nr:hypothetical protein [Streptomycetaceae bacterium]